MKEVLIFGDLYIDFFLHIHFIKISLSIPQQLYINRI